MRDGGRTLMIVIVLAACGGHSRSERSDSGNADSGTTGASTGGTSTSSGGSNASAARGGTDDGSPAGQGATGGTMSPGSKGGATSAGGTGTAVGGSTNIDPDPGEAGQANGSGGRQGSAGRAATGGTGGTGPMGGTSGQAGALTTTITTCNEQFGFLGDWKGSVLDFFFEPQQAIELTLEPDDSGEIAGTFTWGSGDPPPPPTSGDEPWPPGYFDASGGMGSGGRSGGIGFGQAPAPWPGFHYTVVRGAGCDSVFRFGVSTAELWDDWCKLQTPVYTPDQGWGCIYRGGGASDGTTCNVQDGMGHVVATYPQWKCDMCGWAGTSLCTCDDKHCFASQEPTHTFNFSSSQSGATQVLSGPDPTCGDCTDRLELQ